MMDIVCGQELRFKRAISKKYGDRSYSFCCATCKERFSDDPFRYLDRSPVHTGRSPMNDRKR